MTNKLEDIGFYTLSDERAKHASSTSPMWRCEMILTGRCNFKCPYCRGPRKEYAQDMSTEKAIELTSIWAKDGLKNIRYSGGEPTLHQGLLEIVSNAKKQGISRIAISTNGSADFDYYSQLIDAGVNDFSISLDACCSSFCDKMSGIEGKFDIIISNIKKLSELTYVTVGTVIDDKNVDTLQEVIAFASGLGVSDIRIISSAQYNKLLQNAQNLDKDILDKHPILKYRINNIHVGRNVRGISETDSHQCYLVKDDSVIAGDNHYPCVIHMREGGKAIGKVGINMRAERIKWFEQTDIFENPICRKNCLDVCIDYNNKSRYYEKK